MVPTRGLEPPHLAVIDPKSIASAIPPRRPSAPPSCGGLALAEYSEKGTATQIRGGLVPPILSGRSLVATVKYLSTCTVIYLSSIIQSTGYPIITDHAFLWRFVVCWVLSSLARTAATRSHRSVTLSPCSQSHARLARHIAGPAGGLLPHPFTPYHDCAFCAQCGGNPLCCGCSQPSVTG